MQIDRDNVLGFGVVETRLHRLHERQGARSNRTKAQLKRRIAGFT